MVQGPVRATVRPEHDVSTREGGRRVPDGWYIDERTGDADALHASWQTVERHPRRRALAVCQVTGPAVVLGSTQPKTMVDPDRARHAGLAVVRRRSGGGAVLVGPDDPVWIDAWVPRSDPLWSDDVGRAFEWLGEAWLDALGRLGAAGLSAHRAGHVEATRWSRLVCFGGVGTGEIVTARSRKVVGLAQRRTRHGAWFHGACYLRWNPDPLLEVLDLTEAERTEAGHDLRASVAGLTELLPAGGPDVGRPDVVAALLASLP